MLIDSFLNELSDDPVLATEQVCQRFVEFDSKILSDDESDFYEDYISYLALLNTLTKGFSLDFEEPTVGQDIARDIQGIQEYIRSVRESIKLKQAKNKYNELVDAYKIRRGSGFFYEFTDSEVNKLQALINELRETIAKNDKFEADHKRRLLARLERLQSELHKKISDLDRFWGLIGDAGVVVRKLGEDSKPIVDRISELARIIWKAQAKAEALPESSEFPSLPRPEKDNSENET